MESTWKMGPLPPDTWGWGGVTKKSDPGSGFYFADFCGDHVKIFTVDETKVLNPQDVGMYNNSLTLPPNCTQRVS